MSLDQHENVFNNTNAISIKSDGTRRRRVLLKEKKKVFDDQFMAAAIGDLPWLKQSLIDHVKEEPLQMDQNGFTALHLSSLHAHLDCIRYLIEALQCDINNPTKTGWCAVHLVISKQAGKRSFQCLQYLLSNGANPSLLNEDGCTPTHQAASEGHISCLQLLIESHADIRQKDRRGHTPLQLSKLWGNRKCARMLSSALWSSSKDDVADEMRKLKQLKRAQAQRDSEALYEDRFYRNVADREAFQLWLDKKFEVEHSQQELTNEDVEVKYAEKRIKPVEKTVGNREGMPSRVGGGIGKATGKVSSSKRISDDRRLPGGLVNEYINEERRPRETEPKSESRLNERESERSIEFRKTKSEATSHKAKELSDVKTKEELCDNEKSDKFDDVSVSGNKISKLKQKQGTLERWNFSPQIKTREYVTNLQDDYPRDVYTKMPKIKDALKYFDGTFRNVTWVTCEEDVEDNQNVKNFEKYKKNILDSIVLSKVDVDAVLDKDLTLKQRPVVFKTCHIADIATLKQFNNQEKVIPEAGIHMYPDKKSFVFQNCLQNSELDLKPCMKTTSELLSNYTIFDRPSFIYNRIRRAILSPPQQSESRTSDKSESIFENRNQSALEVEQNDLPKANTPKYPLHKRSDINDHQFRRLKRNIEKNSSSELLKITQDHHYNESEDPKKYNIGTLVNLNDTAALKNMPNTCDVGRQERELQERYRNNGILQGLDSVSGRSSYASLYDEPKFTFNKGKLEAKLYQSMYNIPETLPV